MKKKKGLAVLILIFTMLTLLMRHISPARGFPMLGHYATPLVFAFMGAVVMRKEKIRADYLVCAALVGWYVISRMILGENYLETSWDPFCCVAVSCLLAFPFAFGADDLKKKTGLQWIAGIYFALMFVFAVLGILGMILGEQIVFPMFERAHFGKMDTGENRLLVIDHPNICAALFLIALMLGFWLICTLKKRWLTAPWFVMSLCIYAAIGLTVSRTVMLQTAFCIALIGIAFVMHRTIPKVSVKVLACVAAAVFLFTAGYWGFSLTNDLVQAAADSIPVAFAETVEKALIDNRPLLKDMATMTGRTDIYKDVIRMFKENPRVLLFGELEDYSLSMLRKYSPAVSHTHSSYLETILFTGLPGGLIAIYLSLRALWLSFKVVFLQRSTFTDKLLAAFTVTLLISAIPESYLFSNFGPFYNFLFFLIFGYLVETEHALRT